MIEARTKTEIQAAATGRRRAAGIGIVLTWNEEVNLPTCIASLAGLDCDLYVVDSGSTDRTLEIAGASGAKILEHPFENYAAQRNWSQKNFRCGPVGVTCTWMRTNG